MTVSSCDGLPGSRSRRTSNISVSISKLAPAARVAGQPTGSPGLLSGSGGVVPWDVQGRNGVCELLGGMRLFRRGMSSVLAPAGRTCRYEQEANLPGPHALRNMLMVSEAGCGRQDSAALAHAGAARLRQARITTSPSRVACWRSLFRRQFI